MSGSLPKKRIPWNKGKKFSKDDPRYSHLRGRVVSSETRKKISAARTKHIWYSSCIDCGREKGFNRAKRCTFCAAKFRAQNYPNAMLGTKLSEERKMQLLLSSKGRMTRPEKRVQEILYGLFGVGYRETYYTGSGETRFFIRLKNRTKRPDFVDHRTKKVIEVFGRYWHRNENTDSLILEYAEAGWSCLVLWEDELDMNCLDRIHKFLYPYEYEEELKNVNCVS